MDGNLSPSLVVECKTPDFNRIIGDFAILLTFYSVGLLSRHAGFMLRLQFILYWFYKELVYNKPVPGWPKFKELHAKF